MGYIEGVSPNGVPCRVYATAGKEEQGAFALDCCGKVLAYFSEYFGKARVSMNCSWTISIERGFTENPERKYGRKYQ
jgi:hypothetical protein